MLAENSVPSFALNASARGIEPFITYADIAGPSPPMVGGPRICVPGPGSTDPSALPVPGSSHSISPVWCEPTARPREVTASAPGLGATGVRHSSLAPSARFSALTESRACSATQAMSPSTRSAAAYAGPGSVWVPPSAQSTRSSGAKRCATTTPSRHGASAVGPSATSTRVTTRVPRSMAYTASSVCDATQAVDPFTASAPSTGKDVSLMTFTFRPVGAPSSFTSASTCSWSGEIFMPPGSRAYACEASSAVSSATTPPTSSFMPVFSPEPFTVSGFEVWFEMSRGPTTESFAPEVRAAAPASVRLAGLLHPTTSNESSNRFT
ncbi:MAG: hypothetical protein IPJ65_20625 [Archangiaceae bacterium]|nr:hypothetical protein [Archangiaceae bacterium]